MSAATPARRRITVDGKFFRAGTEKFTPRGVAYGPLAPARGNDTFGGPGRAASDLAQIRELGANLVRVYCVPPRWFLDLASDYELRVLVDVPWNRESCFLDRLRVREEARRLVREAATACGRHPALFAFSVVNEIPPDIARWHGAAATADFIDELVGLVKEIDPEILCTFGNFPPTEYLRPREVDFACFNVYLHQPETFRNYLAHLQMLADTKPLLLGEFGLDSLREGETRQAELLATHLKLAFESGVAGTVVYSFTDEWFKDGRLVGDWRFGLTTPERQPKPAFHSVQRVYQAAPHFDTSAWPLVSVVVACYNGARTLEACLSSLGRLNYPRYEVLLVDDGSQDATPKIAAGFAEVRYLRHEVNLGLSAARNTGIAAARGEIVAFTDADCRADEDWLHYLVQELLTEEWAGVGGHNLMPPEDSSVAAVVLVSPGGPTHVMVTDRVAEHIPGCNLAIWKWALLEVGCFDPVFRRAGDDVDICWRLQQRGYALGFCAAGFVWHYRRSTVRDYLRQQAGYGEAEAFLARKHPEYFNPFGGSIWRGRIYSATSTELIPRRPMIYRGMFGSGLFQTLYRPLSSFPLLLVTNLEYHVFVTLPLLVLAPMFSWLLPLGLTSLILSLGACVAAALQAELPRKKRRGWSRPLVAALFALQPIVRGWARYRGRLLLPPTPLASHENLETLSRVGTEPVRSEIHYLARPGFHRRVFLERCQEHLARRGWSLRNDTGWTEFDLEIYASRWSKLQITTASEYAPDGAQILRCRLRGAVTLASRIALWALLGAALLLIGLFGRDWPWLWLAMLVLPALAWWLSQQHRDLQRIVGTQLDEVAEELGLKPVNPDPPDAP